MEGRIIGTAHGRDHLADLGGLLLILFPSTETTLVGDEEEDHRKASSEDDALTIETIDDLPDAEEASDADENCLDDSSLGTIGDASTFLSIDGSYTTFDTVAIEDMAEEKEEKNGQEEKEQEQEADNSKGLTGQEGDSDKGLTEDDEEEENDLEVEEEEDYDDDEEEEKKEMEEYDAADCVAHDYTGLGSATCPSRSFAALTSHAHVMLPSPRPPQAHSATTTHGSSFSTLSSGQQIPMYYSEAYDGHIQRDGGRSRLEVAPRPVAELPRQGGNALPVYFSHPMANAAAAQQPIVPTRVTTTVTEIGRQDYLFGRGHKKNGERNSDHPGNQRVRKEVVERLYRAYRICTRKDVMKNRVIRNVHAHGGRFLIHLQGDEWEVVNDEKAARERIGQLFYEITRRKKCEAG